MENCSICLRAKYVKKAKVVAILMKGKCESTLHVGGILSEFLKVAMVTLLSYFSQIGSMEILKALYAADKLLLESFWWILLFGLLFFISMDFTFNRTHDSKKYCLPVILYLFLLMTLEIYIGLHFIFGVLLFIKARSI